MLDKDSKLIFEAYSKNMHLISEIPVSGPEDLGFTSDPRQSAGGGYGFKGLSDEQVTNLINAVKTKIFKPSIHTVDGKEYQLYYPGSKDKFRAELISLIQNELKLGKTQAGYTARIADNLLNVVKTDSEGGTAASPVAVQKAVVDGAKGKIVSSDAEATAKPSAELIYVRTGTPNFGKADKVSPRVFDELPETFDAKTKEELIKAIEVEAKNIANDILDKKEKTEFFNIDPRDKFDNFANFIEIVADYYQQKSPEDISKEPEALEPDEGTPDIQDIARREFGGRVIPQAVGDRYYTSRED
jgi:hypothetical protein